MDHAQILLNVQLEIMSNIMDTLLTELLMLLELKEYYSADFIDLSFIFLTNTSLFFQFPYDLNKYR